MTVETEAVSHGDMANAIRALAMDAVEAAKSGHPGMPMGTADIATVLFGQVMKFDPAAPDWPDRDRFVLSAGHGSMLLYACLHLLGYADMEMAQLKRFRQFGSKTAGHPEWGHAAGIETTTGPLGQGLANAVGMAMAERLMAERFGEELVDHHTYVLAGDGCLMEGISHEAASLAGHLCLNKLIVIFDDNGISIDGPTALSVSDDQMARFAAYGWAVTAVDGHDPVAIAEVLNEARRSDRPTLIAARTRIGFGAGEGREGTAGVHGAPLKEDGIAAARQNLNWPHAPFEVPAPIVKAWRSFGRRGAAEREAWQGRLERADQKQRSAFERAVAGDLPANLPKALSALKATMVAEKPNKATRESSGRVLGELVPLVPELIGGSADLTGSNNTRAPSHEAIGPGNFEGRYVHYGVREHGMAAAMNGMALHGGIIPYGGTFLVFSDYARPAIRLAALMGLRSIFVMTHDSIGLGEDGPTHQPVEQLAALRAIPNLLVMRPADAVETAECWELALSEHNAPSLLALTRQAVPAVRLAESDSNLCARGGYELVPADGAAAVTLLASGSEVSIAVAARNILQSGGAPTRVVSMPCWALFDRQDSEYRQATLGPGTVRIAIEAGVSMGWERYVGADGGFVGMSGFGASAPYKELYKNFGITAEAVAAMAKDRLEAATRDADQD